MDKAMPPALKEALDKKNEGKDDEAEKAMPPEDEAKKASDPSDMDKAAAAAEAEDDMEEAKKSLSEQDLAKSLDAMEAYLAKSGHGRKQELLKKSIDGIASAEEQAELASILSGGQATLAEEVTKSLDPSENEDLSKSLDATGYLGSLHDGIFEFSQQLAERIEKSMGQQDEFNVVLATGLLNMGRAIDAISKALPKVSGLAGRVEELGKSLDRVAAAPVGRPRGVTPGTKPFEKSMAGSDPEVLTKAQVSDLLDGMLQKSISEGREGRALCGENIAEAATKWELFGALSGPLKQELNHFRGSQVR